MNEVVTIRVDAISSARKRLIIESARVAHYSFEGWARIAKAESVDGLQHRRRRSHACGRQGRLEYIIRRFALGHLRLVYLHPK